jgi:hypothetical protein
MTESTSGVSCTFFAGVLRAAEEAFGPKLMGSAEDSNRVIGLLAEVETIIGKWPKDPAPRPDPEGDGDE